MGEYPLLLLASLEVGIKDSSSCWHIAQLGWESVSGLKTLWLQVQLESLSPAEANPFLEVAVKTNLGAFLKCHFFSYCRNVSSAFILPFSESMPTHWFKEKQLQNLNSWLQEFPSITANPVLLLLGFLYVATSSSPRWVTGGFGWVVVVHKSNLFFKRKINTLKMLVQCSERTQAQRIAGSATNPHEMGRDGKLHLTISCWYFLL